MKKSSTEACLLTETCAPCQGHLPPISEAEMSELMPQIPDWDIVAENGENHLQRSYEFTDFKSALNFTNLVGEIAENVGHHPVLITEWGKVTIIWWTHAINGLHRNDFIMAAKTDEVFRTSH